MYKLPLVLSFLFIWSIINAQQIKIQVNGPARLNTPVTINLKKPDGKNTYGLYNTTSKKTYPLQWYDQQHAIFILTDSVSPGKNISFEVKKITEAPVPFKIVTSNAGLEFRIKDKPVFFYHTAIAEPPADSPAYYRRSGFIHPLYSPAGKIMTDDFPSNHAHQHGVFHAWTNNTFKKEHLDFWNQHQGTGTVRHREILSHSKGPVFSELRTKQEYISLKYGVVLEEEWTIRVYPFADYFIFDLHITQTNITHDTLFMNRYIYGGMAFRGSREWDPFNKKYYRNSWNILTSEGMKDSSANHTPARWVTAFGNINGIMSSATVFNHSSDIRYPQKIRVHPNMPYWVYAPVVDGELLIAPGGKYEAAYRYFISSTLPDNLSLERIHEIYIHPPETIVTK
jgi:hypothetical protein